MEISKQYKSNLIAAIIFMTIILIVIIIGLCIPVEKQEIQGMTEITDYRVSSKVPGRIKKFYVNEGDRVRIGDTLAILEAHEIDAKLAQAEAARSAAQAIEEKAYNGTRQEQIRAAFEVWQKAKAGLEIAEKTYGRLSRLYNNGVVPAQKRDEAEANYKAMQASEKAAKSQYDMAIEGARREDKEMAKAQVNRAKGAISEVSSYVKETVLIAVANGEVTEIFPEIGELVGTGAPIMNINITTDAWFTFNIREDMLYSIYVGEKMNVYIPALQKTVPVKITLIKNVGDFAAWKATKSLGQYDLKIFEVQARPLQPMTKLEPGMSAILKK